MSKTNSLTSHYPERRTHRADKMSGMGKGLRSLLSGSSKKFIKKFASKKRRQVLKTDKI